MIKIFLCFALLSITILSGCNGLIWGQSYQKENIVFTGSYSGWIKQFDKEKAEFDRFTIGSYPNFKRTSQVVFPQVYLELKDGSKLYLPSLNLENMKDRYVIDHNYGDASVLVYKGEGVLEGSHIYIYQKQITCFTSPSDYVAIWDKQLRHEYPNPLSYKDLLELFGTPDKVDAYFLK